MFIPPPAAFPSIHSLSTHQLIEFPDGIIPLFRHSILVTLPAWAVSISTPPARAGRSSANLNGYPSRPPPAWQHCICILSGIFSYITSVNKITSPPPGRHSSLLSTQASLVRCLLVIYLDAISAEENVGASGSLPPPAAFPVEPGMASMRSNQITQQGD